MKTLILKSIAVVLFAASPSLLQAQALNPAQMPPPTAPSLDNTANSTNTIPAVTLPDPTAPLAVTNAGGDSVVVGANGIYAVHFASPAWTAGWRSPHYRTCGRTTFPTRPPLWPVP